MVTFKKALVFLSESAMVTNISVSFKTLDNIEGCSKQILLVLRALLCKYEWFAITGNQKFKASFHTLKRRMQFPSS